MASTKHGGKYSKERGKRGERQFRDICREEGYDDVRRSVQYCGNTGDAADCVGLPHIYVEVKNVERLNIWDAMNQAVSDCTAAGNGDIPIVAHTKNRKGFLVTMQAADFFKLYREWEAGQTGR